MTADLLTSENGLRTQPMYTFGEVARMSGVSASTVRNWIRGYSNRDIQVQPLFDSGREEPMVSFLQLVEILVAGRFRKLHRVKFSVVKRAYENARSFYNVEYPFANLRLQAIGGHIIQVLSHDVSELSFQAIDMPEQWTIPGLVSEVIDQLEYEHDLAARWYPVGKSVPIVVDPRISSGVPTFKGRGVTIKTIRNRWKSGQNIDFIAKDFEIDPSLIETTLRYADQIAA